MEWSPAAFLQAAKAVRTVYRQGSFIFREGDPADAVFYIIDGIVMCRAENEVKRDVVAILRERDFFGEECVLNKLKRRTTATVMTECLIARIEQMAMLRRLYEDLAFADMFISFLVRRNNGFRETACEHPRDGALNVAQALTPERLTDLDAKFGLRRVRAQMRD